MSNPKKSAGRILGVIFDMDGVLCDSESFMCEAARRMFAESYGVTVRPEDFIPFVGAGENRYLGGVAEACGIRLDLKRDKARAYEIYLEIIKGRLEPLPGCREFIAACRSRGLKIAVATSADYVKMAGNLTALALPPETFDVCVNGLDVTHKKPHPEIFLLAAERLGLPTDKCLVVEDAPNGVRAAKSAGASCLALMSSFDAEALSSAGADLVAADLAEAKDKLFGGP